MSWVFKIGLGEFIDPDRKILTNMAYSGHPPHVNDIAAYRLKGVGPIPVGTYGIGEPRDPPDHLGPLAMPLHPSASTATYGRSGFFIHGDNRAMDHTASDGCIILSHDIRAIIAESDDKTLLVTY
jgi:hypothetical protein